DRRARGSRSRGRSRGRLRSTSRRRSRGRTPPRSLGRDGGLVEESPAMSDRYAAERTERRQDKKAHQRKAGKRVETNEADAYANFNFRGGLREWGRSPAVSEDRGRRSSLAGRKLLKRARQKVRGLERRASRVVRRERGGRNKRRGRRGGRGRVRPPPVIREEKGPKPGWKRLICGKTTAPEEEKEKPRLISGKKQEEVGPKKAPGLVAKLKRVIPGMDFSASA
ncbi:unnamed protein product, partial [Amoebophrya sp. A25]